MQTWKDMEAYRQRQLDLQREAAVERLAKVARNNTERTNPLYAPLLAGVGRQLTNLGQQLQERYEPQPRLAVES